MMDVVTATLFQHAISLHSKRIDNQSLSTPSGEFVSVSYGASLLLMSFTCLVPSFG